jgi:hypothetical protein
MNFVGGALLYIIKDEEITFWILLAMVQKFHLENLFVSGVPELHLRTYQFNHYVSNILPELYAHFRVIGLTNGFFTSKWIITVFSWYLHIDSLARVWDGFFMMGWKVIYKVGIAILKMFKEEILKFDIEQMSNFMRDGSRRVKVDVVDLMQQARKIIITDKELLGLEHCFHVE